MVKKDIPVIFYNDKIPAWDAVDKNSEPARIAAIYKNQSDEAERARLRESGSGERYALRNERRRAAEAAETTKKKRKRISGPAFFLLVAALFYFLWMFVQN